MIDPTAKTWLEVSRSALTHNVGAIRALLEDGTDFMAVVKSNAYGHGLEPVASAVAERVDWFGVDSLAEAEKLRGLPGLADQKILILGFTPAAAHRPLVQGGFRSVVYDLETARSLNEAAASLGVTARVHLKIETGTTRQGIWPAELPDFAAQVAELPALKVEGIYTHFANIEDTSDASYAQLQLSRFKEAMQTLRAAGLEPSVRHATCSAAAMLFPETHFDLARVGISLYGLWSSALTCQNLQANGTHCELRPALTWKTRIAQVKAVPAGTPISYGLTEKVDRDSRVAVLPVGYWDGYDRRLSSVGQVLVRGQRAKVLGRVCMNMMMVDVTGINGVRTGEEVVLLGRQGGETISAEELAEHIGTINYEVVTRINPLLPRNIVD
jgi:alanine racemase